MDLNTSAVEAHFTLMTKPREHGLPMRSIDECFIKTETVTAKHLLFGEYLAEQPLIEKIMFYIMMEQIYGPGDGNDQKGDLGWNLRFVPRAQAAEIERDEWGYFCHPVLLDELALLPDVGEDGFELSSLRSFAGVETATWLAQNDDDLTPEDVDRIDGTGIGPQALQPNAALWDPIPPDEGKGWFLISIHSTEDGIACTWARWPSAEDLREKMEDKNLQAALETEPKIT